jgi:hypothetical protein
MQVVDKRLAFDADDDPLDYRFLEANLAFERQAGGNLWGKWVSSFAPDLERWLDVRGVRAGGQGG